MALDAALIKPWSPQPASGPSSKILSSGMLGGYLSGVLSLGIQSGLYLKANFNALVPKDMFTGLAKSFVFAFLIGMISAHEGLSV